MIYYCVEQGRLRVFVLSSFFLTFPSFAFLGFAPSRIIYFASPVC